MIIKEKCNQPKLISIFIGPIHRKLKRKETKERQRLKFQTWLEHESRTESKVNFRSPTDSVSEETFLTAWFISFTGLILTTTYFLCIIIRSQNAETNLFKNKAEMPIEAIYIHHQSLTIILTSTAGSECSVTSQWLPESAISFCNFPRFHNENLGFEKRIALVISNNIKDTSKRELYQQQMLNLLIQHLHTKSKTKTTLKNLYMPLSYKNLTAGILIAGTKSKI